MSRFRLIPREEKFYDDFVAMAEQISAGARLLEEMFSVDPPSAQKAHDVKEVEHKCDFLTHELIQRLNKTFVTPIDREDIHTLATQLDDVVDYIEEVADFMGLYRIEAPMDQAQALASILVDSCRQIAQGMPRLRSFDSMSHFVVEIHRLENEGDRVAREAVASLFEGGIDPMVVIRWKDIFDRLEDAIDATERVANILEGITIKNT